MGSEFDSMVSGVGGLNDTVMDLYGVPVAYRLKGSLIDIDIRGIPTRTPAEQDGGTGQAISTVIQSLCVVNVDLPRAPVKGDTCRFEGIRYEVVDPQPEGATRTNCILARS